MRYQALTGIRWLTTIITAVALAGMLGASASAQTASSSCQSQTSSQTQITINGETIVDDQASTVSYECGSLETNTDTEVQTSDASLVAESDSGDVTEEDGSRVAVQSAIPAVPANEDLVDVITLLIEAILAEVGI